MRTVLYFGLLICANLGIDVSTALGEKLAIPAARHPVERARGSNQKYTELSRQREDVQ
ncbi:MAG: hypothetical protein VX733_14205 [Candidatus Latescibacterota bacterium]|nr:hypothetical protein [Candidatus Latescibacterota bacterium]